jgi:hypothetical protein
VFNPRVDHVKTVVYKVVLSQFIQITFVADLKGSTQLMTTRIERYPQPIKSTFRSLNPVVPKVWGAPPGGGGAQDVKNYFIH